MVRRSKKTKISLVAQVAPQQPKRRPRRRRTRRSRLNKRLSPINMAGLSAAGQNFLKCAFASPDFSVDPGQGIPDGYEGKALMRKDVHTDALSFTAAKDTFILVLPTPGIAYWKCEVANDSYPSQSTDWTPVYNSSFVPMFGSTTVQTAAVPLNPIERDVNVSKFRYASSTVEITPTSNFMTYSGSITFWKLPVGLTLTAKTVNDSAGTTQSTAPQFALNGLNGLSMVSPDNKPFKFIDGGYSLAVNTEPTFEFQEIMSGITRIPGVGSSATDNPTYGQFLGDIVGVGHLQTLVIRISTPAAAVNSGIIKTWSCIEYQPNGNSAFYQFAGVSPKHDPLAMKLYREIALKLPVAVSCAENDGFWSDRVLPLLKGFMNTARTAGAFLPPLGQMVSGIDLITGAFAML